MDCGSVILTPLYSHPSPPSPPSGPWILEPQIIGPLREPWAGFWIPDFHAIRSPSTSFELNLDAVLHQVRCSPAAAFLDSGFWISRYLGAFFGVTFKPPPTFRSRPPSPWSALWRGVVSRASPGLCSVSRRGIGFVAPSPEQSRGWVTWSIFRSCSPTSKLMFGRLGTRESVKGHPTTLRCF